MTDFLNTPLLEISGYSLYPLFFAILLILPILIILVVVIKNSRKNKLPKESRKKQRTRETIPTKKSEDLDGNPFNDFNIVSSWQKDNLIEMLEEDLESYQEEEGVMDDDYTNLVSSIISYIRNAEYWSVSDLVKISPNAVLFLTMLTAEKLEGAVHDLNIDRTVLFANSIDRFNGAFESGASTEREWMHTVSEPVSSNYTGPIDGKRMLGCIISAINFVGSKMDDGIMPDDVMYTDNSLQMVSQSQLRVAINELTEAQNFITDISRGTQELVLYSLVFKLRYQIDNIINSTLTQTIRPLDFNIIRAISVIADRQDYSEILTEFND